MLNTSFRNAHAHNGHEWQIGRDGNADWNALKKNVPSVFAVEAHESRSDRYGVVSTAEVLRALWSEGWCPVSAIEAVTRDESKAGFTKHMLRLRKLDDLATPVAMRSSGKGGISELIIVNSFDGSTSFQCLAGRFEFVCANGLIVGKRIDEIRVPHRRNIVAGVVEAATTIGGTFRAVDAAVDAMKAIPLTPVERMDFAAAAHALRFPVKVDEATGEKSGGSPIGAQQLLTPLRAADAGHDLWTTFNVVQEHCIRGGDTARSPYDRENHRRGRRTTSRPVGGIDQNVKLNRALWTLAEEAASLKGVNLAA